jgi:hypothetical protein
VIRLTFEYIERSQLVLTTSDFSTIQEAEAKITGEPSRKMMINSSGTAHLVNLDYRGLLLEDMETGETKLIGEGVTRTDPVVESTIAPVVETIVEAIATPVLGPVAPIAASVVGSVVEAVEETIMEPEILSPGETTSSFDGGENLPEIPTKFKSFRDFFQDQNRMRNGFLNSIAEKMSKGNDILKFMDQKLDEENQYVDVLREKYLGK